MATPFPAPEPDPVFAQTRVSYEAGALEEADLAEHPLAQFRRWYHDAVAARLREPNAMVVATADTARAPSVRTVLLKQADARGFVFYTNYASRKARELEGGRAALLFPWHLMDRQVAMRGLVEKVSREESASYFATRPWGSRIGAWASRQSAVVPSREMLEERWRELAERWPDHGRPDDVPLPDHWGGYLVRPIEVEFWQGRPSRLHDRLVYLARRDGGTPPLDDADEWRIERRQP